MKKRQKPTSVLFSSLIPHPFCEPRLNRENRIRIMPATIDWMYHRNS
jgi:hypothetical protein